MANEQIAINPDIIRWARDRAGYDLDTAMQKFASIAAWEAGEASPTYPQIERLAEVFKVPVAVFFFPEPPQLPPIRDSFRTLPDAEFQQIPRHIRFLLRKAKALQLNLAELCNGRNPAKKVVTKDLVLNADDRVANAVNQLREYIEVSLAQQTTWKTDDEALESWRSAFNAIGVYVFKDAFRDRNFSGFCLYDDEFPIIYVNNSDSKTRQIFTLFHELAHILFQTSGIDTKSDEFVEGLPEDDRRIEVFCNRFAAEFLVPREAFEDRLAGREPTEATATALAAHFKVSREVIFRKFLDRNFISQEQYQEAAARWAAQKKGGAGGDYYWTKLSYLGREYVQLALSQYHQNRISEEQLAEYLDAKPKHVETLEAYFARENA